MNHLMASPPWFWPRSIGICTHQRPEFGLSSIITTRPRCWSHFFMSPDSKLSAKNTSGSFANGARDGRHLRIRRHLGDESFRVELPQFVLAHAAGQRRNVVHVGVVHHGGERFLAVVGGKLVPDVFLPEFVQGFLVLVHGHGLGLSWALVVRFVSISP